MTVTDRSRASPNDAHLMAEGEVSPGGALLSGDFTYSGHLGNTFSLTDGSGTPSGASLGYSVNYLSSEDMTLNDSGSLIPDSSNQGTNTVTETQSGQVADSDSLGDSASIGFGENVDVIDSCDGSQPIAGENDSPTPSQPTTISASGPKSPVPTGSGKNTVYVIEVEAPGNALDKTIASGKDILNALRPAAEDLVNAKSVNLTVKGIKKAMSTKGGAGRRPRHRRSRPH